MNGYGRVRIRTAFRGLPVLEIGCGFRTFEPDRLVTVQRTTPD